MYPRWVLKLYFMVLDSYSPDLSWNTGVSVSSPTESGIPVAWTVLESRSISIFAEFTLKSWYSTVPSPYRNALSRPLSTSESLALNVTVDSMSTLLRLILESRVRVVSAGMESAVTESWPRGRRPLSRSIPDGREESGTVVETESESRVRREAGVCGSGLCE